MVDKEQLSALLDGELDQLATVRLLRALDADPQALAAWEDYGLIGDALRERDGPGSAGCAGARRALAQIAAEPAPAARPARRLPALRPLAPWAVAASAAVLAFRFGAPLAASVSEQVASWVHGPSTQLVEGIGSPGGPGDPMARYIDYHREMAASGFEQAALVTVVGGERGR